MLAPADAENSVREALKMGYRLIDTANAYVRCMDRSGSNHTSGYLYWRTCDRRSGVCSYKGCTGLCSSSRQSCESRKNPGCRKILIDTRMMGSCVLAWLPVFMS